jgi:hypothetical protein
MHYQKKINIPHLGMRFFSPCFGRIRNLKLIQTENIHLDLDFKMSPFRGFALLVMLGYNSVIPPGLKTATSLIWKTIHSLRTILPIRELRPVS